MAKKRYRVVGTQPVLGYQPGEMFDDKISEEQEAFLKEIGAIRVVAGRPPADPQKGVEKAAVEREAEQEEAKRNPDGADVEE